MRGVEFAVVADAEDGDVDEAVGVEEDGGEDLAGMEGDEDFCWPAMTW